MFQMFSRRGSMGGHREDEIDDLRREIKGLKEEIVKLQSGREALKVSKDRKDSTCPQTKD
jgi:cell division protein FtsB